MQTAASPRNPGIATFVAALERAVMADAPEGSEARVTAVRVFDRVRVGIGTPGGQGAVLPVCSILPECLTAPEFQRRRPVADAFAALAPRLRWTRKATDPDPPFRDRHANAMILGPEGVEDRSDIWIGASLMAPGTDYPIHRHGPEEVYLPLTSGEWWNDRMDWTDPGPSGLVYNPPGIRHAMRSGEGPFLAIWLLPV